MKFLYVIIVGFTLETTILGKSHFKKLGFTLDDKVPYLLK